MVVSFTGHRPDKIAGWAHSPEVVEQTIREAVAREIVRQSKLGAEEFVSGMAPGFDLWAADEVDRLRREGAISPATKLTLAIPYPHFERSFDTSYHPLYNHIMEVADEVIYVSEHYHKGCYAMRNDYLAERANTLVAYYEGTEGGTRYTLRRGRHKGCRCVNLHQGDLF